ncbi:MAG: hypothetical protein GYA57_19225 [Myxococcales bacterium]|nr:hypothetical protein [Myxococcales bacterium]
MLGRWMQVFGTLRPWMVAAALAAASWPACSKGGSARAEKDVGAAPCEPKTVYGPPTCQTDEDCRGPGREDWVCGGEPLTFDDGCGHRIEWGRVCEAGPGSGAAPGGAAGSGAPSSGSQPAARTDLPPPLPARDVGPAEE